MEKISTAQVLMNIASGLSVVAVVLFGHKVRELIAFIGETAKGIIAATSSPADVDAVKKEVVDVKGKVDHVTKLQVAMQDKFNEEMTRVRTEFREQFEAIKKERSLASANEDPPAKPNHGKVILKP